jgi:phosphoribosylformimino-5-aminoimidazole carboxamide ribotide isomerase
MRLIPVIDLKGGEVVRGIAGRRAEYRPWVSPLCGTSEPLAVARALVERARARELYVADLDAIAGAPPACALYARLRALGVELWADAGLKYAEDAGPLITSGLNGIIAALESLNGRDELSALAGRVGGARVILSLDLVAGLPLGHARAWWPPPDNRGQDEVASALLELVGRAADLGVQRVIVLDVSRVGTGGGTGTEELCRRLTTAHPGIELIAGGGVRDRDDLKRLEDSGVAAALVAPALHQGRLPRRPGI